MANRYYTAEQVRDAFHGVLRSRSQAEIARECGCQPQHISLMVQGANITGKVLTWLGFKRATVYEKVK